MFFKKEVSIPAKSSSEIPADHDLSQSTKLKDAIQVELTAPEEKKASEINWEISMLVREFAYGALLTSPIKL